MPILLDVPYSEKDEAKKLGAWWSSEKKKWYVKNKSDYHKFRKWISKSEAFYIICDYLYVIEGTHTCFKCHKPTRVIGYGIENYLEYDEENNASMEYEESNEIHIAGHINPIPQEVLAYLQKKYNYKNRYSKFANCTYLANCCDNCDVLQGDFFLFNEVDSPFWIEDETAASNLKLYKIPLEYDMVLDSIDIGFGSNDHLIKEYASTELLKILI